MFEKRKLRNKPRSSKTQDPTWKNVLKDFDFSDDGFEYEVINLIESTHLAWPVLKCIQEASEQSYQYHVITMEDVTEQTQIENVCGITDSSLTFQIISMFGEEFREKLNTTPLMQSNLIPYLVKLNMMKTRERYLQKKKDREVEKKEIAEEISKLKSKKDGKPDKGKKGKKGKEKDQDSIEKPSKKEKKEKKGKTDSKVNIWSKPKDTNILFNRKCIQEEPNLPIYFILISFYDNFLLKNLEELGVTVSYFIEIGTEQRLGPLPNFTEEEEIRLWKMNAFWRDWKNNHYLISKMLPESTCFLKYVPDYSEEAIGKTVYRDLKRILANMKNMKRYYKTFLENLNLLDVEEKAPIVKIEDLEIYNKKLSEIPNECITIPLILTYLLDEIEQRFNPGCVSSGEESDEVKTPEINKSKFKCVKQKLLQKLQCHSQRNVNKIEVENKESKKSFYFCYGNHLDYLLGYTKKPKTLKSKVLSVLKLALPLQIFKNYKILNDTERLWNEEVLRNWSTVVPDITKDDLERSCYGFLWNKVQFCFSDVETLRKPSKNVSRIQEFIYGEKSPESEFPKVYIKPKYLSLEKSKIFTSNMSYSKSSTNVFDKNNMHFFEYFDRPTMIQVINDAYEEYLYFDFKYLKLFDTVLLKFSRNCSNVGLSKKRSFICTLTNLYFRDFCAYIFQEYLDYFKREQEEYDKTHTKTGKVSLLVVYEEKIFKPEDFIIPGSFKHQKLQEEKRPKQQAEKGGKKKKSEKKETKMKKDNNKEEKSVDKRESAFSKQKHDFASKGKVGKILETEKGTHEALSNDYDFYGYDIDSHYVNLKTQITMFETQDNMIISVRKVQFPINKISYIFNIVTNENVLIIHCRLDKNLVPINAFSFHLYFCNGIIAAFEKQDTMDMESNLSYICSNFSLRSNKQIQTSMADPNEKTEETRNLILSETENEVYQKFKSFYETKVLPKLRIISSPLHKYRYVKRIKSNVNLSVDAAFRRIFCTPRKNFKNLEKYFANESEPKEIYRNLLVSKYAKTRMFFTEKTNHFNWRITLPTGLAVHAVPILDPDNIYIKQKYILPRTDLVILKDEKYRCFLPNGMLMKFMKNGSIITYHYNRSIRVYKYGYFEPDEDVEFTPPRRAEPKKNFSNISLCRKHNTRFARKIMNICKKLGKSKTNITDSMHLQSRKMENENTRKVYHLSKRLFNNGKYLYPLVNTEIITSSGTRFTVRNNIVCEETQKYQEITHKDYLSNETLLNREDGTKWLLSIDGRATTEFNDGSRIITWPTINREDLCIKIQTTVMCYGEESIGNTNHYESYQEEGTSSESKNYFMSENDVRTPDDAGKETFYSVFTHGRNPNANLTESATPSTRKFHFSKTSTEEKENPSRDSCKSVYTIPLSATTSAANENAFSNSIKSKVLHEIMSPWILIDLNYSFEHPNFASVSFNTTEKTTCVQLPDQIEVCIGQNSSYKIRTSKNDIIDIDKINITATSKSCQNCGGSSKCNLKISPFITGEYDDEIFLHAKDSSGKLFTVDFFGRTYTENGAEDSGEGTNNNVLNTVTKRPSVLVDPKKSVTKCTNHDETISERLFVLRRNLSGYEYFHNKPTSFFVHCFQDYENPKYFTSVDTHYDTIFKRVTKTLKSTRSNQLMMLYDNPILNTKNAALCKDNIWNFRSINFEKFKINEPVSLHLYRMISTLKNFEEDILEQGLYKYFLPSEVLGEEEQQSVEFSEDFQTEELQEEEHEEWGKIVRSIPEKPRPSVLCEVRSAMKFYKSIIEQKEVPKYFEILKGQMFVWVSECAEKAMKEGDMNYICNILNDILSLVTN